jgi:hypothetical protein
MFNGRYKFKYVVGLLIHFQLIFTLATSVSELKRFGDFSHRDFYLNGETAVLHRAMLQTQLLWGVMPCRLSDNYRRFEIS